MKPAIALACLGLLTAFTAFADTPMVPEPLAPLAQPKSGRAPLYKPAAKLRLPAPTITVTRLVRQADGSLRMQCDQEPNPRAKIALPPNRVATPNAQVQQ
ncbi:MAG: hypothetical protein KGH92_08605 [Xanthomonadaceae bacterium]|nr:hypothetical protein [Xanthomonadaceae bacterium]